MVNSTLSHLIQLTTEDNSERRFGWEYVDPKFRKVREHPEVASAKRVIFGSHPDLLTLYYHGRQLTQLAEHNVHTKDTLTNLDPRSHYVYNWFAFNPTPQYWINTTGLNNLTEDEVSVVGDHVSDNATGQTTVSYRISIKGDCTGSLAIITDQQNNKASRYFHATEHGPLAVLDTGLIVNTGGIASCNEHGNWVEVTAEDYLVLEGSLIEVFRTEVNLYSETTPSQSLSDIDVELSAGRHYDNRFGLSNEYSYLFDMMRTGGDIDRLSAIVTAIVVSNSLNG